MNNSKLHEWQKQEMDVDQAMTICLTTHSNGKGKNQGGIFIEQVCSIQQHYNNRFGVLYVDT